MGDKAKRIWRVDEEPVELYVVYDSDGADGVEWLCPGCREHTTIQAYHRHEEHTCSCGTKVVIHSEATLEELEPDA